MVLERGADEVGEICGKTETEAPVSTRNLQPERESCKKNRLESLAGRALTFCRPVSFPDLTCKELCSVEPDPHVCDDTSRDRRLYWRTEDVHDVEQDEEHHKKQVEVEDLVGEC